MVPLASSYGPLFAKPDISCAMIKPNISIHLEDVENLSRIKVHKYSNFKKFPGTNFQIWSVIPEEICMHFQFYWEFISIILWSLGTLANECSEQR